MFRPIRTVTLGLLFLASVFLISCGSSKPTPAPKPPTKPAAAAAATRKPKPAVTTAPAAAPSGNLKVVAVESFIADIAQNVAGDRQHVDTLLPIGTDPYTFKPSDDDIKKAETADVLIANGGGYEDFLDTLVENASEDQTLIETADGLESRKGKEGDTTRMTPQMVTDAMCKQAADSQPTAVKAGGDADNAAELDSPKGLYSVALTKQSDGTYGGAVTFTADQDNAFQLVTTDGKMTVTEDGDELEIEQTLKLNCSGLTTANIITLDQDGEYVLELDGFKSAKTNLLVGPAIGQEVSDDPQFWMDPQSVVTYVENIRDGLTEADPDGEATYEANADAYIAKLDALDKKIQAEAESIPEANRNFVTDHDTFGYFAERYGLHVVGMLVPKYSTANANSTAKQITAVTNAIKASQAKAIFLGQGIDSKTADQIAQATGAQVITGLYANSLSDAGGPAATYLDMVQYNAETIINALK